MKTIKKLLVVTLIACMAFGGAITALASASPTPGVSATNGSITATNGTGSLQTTFTGVIVPTTLTVSVPSTVVFHIDPTKTAGDNVGVQITPPTLTVTNSSIVPVTLTISACSVTTGVTLVNVAPAAEAVKNVMFAIKHTAPTSFGTVGDWLMTEGVFPYNVLPSTTPAIKAGGTINIHIFGQTTGGWSAGDSFVIQPTFVVAPAGTGVATIP